MGRDAMYTAGVDGSSSRPEAVTGTDGAQGKHAADVSLLSFAGNPVLIGPNGTMNVAELVRLVGGNFISGEVLLSHIWIEEFTGSGNTSTTDGELVIASGTTANSIARVESARTSRFITSTQNLTHQAISTPLIAAANVRRRWGAFNPVGGITDGIFVELTGDGSTATYSFVRFKNGAEAARINDDAWIASGGLIPVIKTTDVSIWEIMYNAGTFFLRQNGILVAKLSAVADAAFGDSNLRMGHEVELLNGNTTNQMILTRGSAISRLGAHAAVPIPFVIQTVGTFQIKNGPGRLHEVVITNRGAGQATIEIFDTRDLIGGLIPANYHVSPIGSANVQGQLTFETEFDQGLVVVQSGNSVDFTIVFD